MTSVSRLVWLLLVSATVVACDDGTGQRSITKSLFVRGSSAPVELKLGRAKNGDDPRTQTTVRIESFEMAFGPVYLCAGTSAGDLCKTARAEWLGSRRTELIGTGSNEVGLLTGLSGSIRSYMFDLGRVSYRASGDVEALPAAEELGASVVILGTVTREAIQVPLSIRVNVDANASTGRGIPTVASALGIPEIQLEEDGNGVEFHFELDRILEPALETSLGEDEPCSVSRRNSCHAGRWETCDEVGLLTREEDCSAKSEICVADVGCAKHIAAETDDALSRALRFELVAGTRPSMELIESRASR